MMLTPGTTAVRTAVDRARRAPALAAALAVIAFGAPALMLIHHAAPLALPRARAITDAVSDVRSQPALAGVHWDTVTVGAVDGQLDRVSFFEHDQIVAEIAVRRGGQIVQGANFQRRAIPYGNWLAYEPGVLAALAALFVLVAGVSPLQRLRNLDVAAALSLLAPVVLLQQRYVDASVLAAVPGLAYLMARSAWVALGPPRSSAPCGPLLNAVTPGLDGAGRIRMMRLLLLALALVFVMVDVSSPDAVDVIYGVMEGATKLIHGVLPYGHMPGGVIHGDTYPLLSYALYAPIAAVEPVGSTWDSVDVALAAGVAAALATAWGLVRSTAGARRRDARRPPELEEAGLRAALAWLSFPPLLITVSTGTTDVVLAAMLVMATLLWRRPGLSSGLLAAAAWFKLAPVALLPVWLAPLRGRRLAAAVAAVGAVSGAMLCLLLALGSAGGVVAMLHAISYQFSRGSPQSLWAALGIERWQPLGQACLLALIFSAAVRFHRSSELANDGTRIAAIAAAILIGLQLAADYWAFLYLVWVLPLLCLSVLESRGRSEARAPSQTELQPGAAQPVWVQ